MLLAGRNTNRTERWQEGISRRFPNGTPVLPGLQTTRPYFVERNCVEDVRDLRFLYPDAGYGEPLRTWASKEKTRLLSTDVALDIQEHAVSRGLTWSLDAIQTMILDEIEAFEEGGMRETRIPARNLNEIQLVRHGLTNPEQFAPKAQPVPAGMVQQIVTSIKERANAQLEIDEWRRDVQGVQFTQAPLLTTTGETRFPERMERGRMLELETYRQEDNRLRRGPPTRHEHQESASLRFST